MTDKLRKTQPLQISFSEGEQPSAAKLSAMATQTRNGSHILERAIGDLWNQSGDTILTSYPLQIANLARLLGENKYLNPTMYPMFEDFTFYEYVGETWEGETQGHLRFRPKTVTITPVTGATQFTTNVTNERDVGDPDGGFVANEYWVDTDTGKFRVDSPLVSTDIISYVVDPTVYEDTDDALPGVIPDPRQIDFQNCRVSEDVSGRYLIHLPPRRPLTFGATPDTFDGSQARPARYPSASEVSYASNSKDDATATKRYWNGSTTAVVDEHYRYRLPKELLDVYSSMSNGQEYPSGSLYLWNTATGTIIEGAVFKKPTIANDPWVIEVDVTNSTFTFTGDAAVTTTEVVANYDVSNLVLITCGSPLARNVFNTLARQLTHSHDGSDMVSGISHGSLNGLNPPEDANAEHTGRYPDLPRWSPSRWNNDDHTSLLSRAGSYGSNHGDRRDPNDNAMLGDLILANSQAIANNVFLSQSCANDSFSIYFGDVTGSRIYCANGAGIQAEAYSGSGLPGITGTGDGSGEGGYFIGGSSGDGLYAEASGSGKYGINAVSTLSHGVNATSNAASGGYGVKGHSVGGYGVWGYSDSSSFPGVYGSTTVGGIGVEGKASTVNGTGVSGTGFGTGFGGIFAGGSVSGTGIRGTGYGTGYGGHFIGGSSSYGVYGIAAGNHGVYGTTSDGSSAGVYGTSTVSGGDGVEGLGNGTGYGVKGTGGATGNGVWGVGGDTSGTGIVGEGGISGAIGVLGYGIGSGTAIRGTSVSGYGGNFSGHASGGASGKAALHIAPQTTAPSTAVEGDVYIDSTDTIHQLHYCGSGNVWHKVFSSLNDTLKIDGNSGKAIEVDNNSVSNPTILADNADAAGRTFVARGTSTNDVISATNNGVGYAIEGINTVNGDAIHGHAEGSGTGVHGESDIGYGVIAEGKNDPSVTGKSSLRIVPQIGFPATLNDGDIWIYNNNVYVRLGGVTRIVTVT